MGWCGFSRRNCPRAGAAPGDPTGDCDEVDLELAAHKILHICAFPAISLSSCLSNQKWKDTMDFAKHMGGQGQEEPLLRHLIRFAKSQQSNIT